MIKLVEKQRNERVDCKQASKQASERYYDHISNEMFKLFRFATKCPAANPFSTFGMLCRNFQVELCVLMKISL